MNCGPAKPLAAKCGPNAGELPGRPNGCGAPPEGEPNGPLVGPLYCVLPIAPLTFDDGAGPGVDEFEGAGDAVYCGVFEPGPP